jgi:transcriptional regulator with XRE-family HTH domain
MHVLSIELPVQIQCIEREGMMTTTWGLRVAELLREHKKSPAWLAKQTGISRGAISNWINNPDGVQPEPGNVTSVALAFGLKARDLAPYAGFPITESKDLDDRARRRLRTIESSERFAKAVDKIDRLSARDQDTLYSLVETFIENRTSDH